jgi:hypothetical protein
MNSKEFWVTNISKMDVSLSDLNLTIRSFTTVNLMDSKHYYYTLDQLYKSAETGSLFKKRDKIVVRQVAPKIEKKKILLSVGGAVPSRERSIYQIKEEKFEELQVDDTKFAEENADLAEMDRQPIIIKGNK